MHQDQSGVPDAGEGHPPYLLLGGLPPAARFVAIASVAAWALVAIQVLALGLSVDVPGGSFEVPAVGEVPKALAPAVYLALAATAAALTLTSLSPGWKLARLTRVGIAVVGIVFATVPLAVADTIDDAEGAGRPPELSRDQARRALERKSGRAIPASELPLFNQAFRRFQRENERRAEEARLAPAFTPGFLRFCGWAGLVAAVAAAISGGLARRLRHSRLLAAAAAASPYLLGLAGYVLLLATSRQSAIPLGMLNTQAMIAIVASVGFFVPALLLWQAVAGARVARDLGRGAARTLDRLPYVLAVFLFLKVVWLAFAYSGVLPAALGGDIGALEASADDDLLSWALAGLAGMGVAVWLAKRCTLRAEEGRLDVAAAVIIGVFVAPLALAAAALLVSNALSPFVAPGSWSLEALFDVGDWFSSRLLAVQVAAVYGAGVAGLLLWRKRGHGAVAAFLLLFSVMALPRAIGITATWGSPEGAPGRYELVTLDTMITVAVVLLLLGPWRRSRLVTDAGLVVVVVCSTAIAYAGTLVSSFWGDGAFYLALLLPTFYGLTLGARQLNRLDRHRTARVLGFVGAAAGLLAISLVQLTSGLAGPGRLAGGEIGRLLLAPPLAAILVAAACSALRERPEGARPDRHRASGRVQPAVPVADI